MSLCNCTALPPLGEEGQPGLSVSLQFPAGVLTVDELKSTLMDERVLAQMFRSQGRKEVYRKESLNEKQLSKIPAQMATGCPWSKEPINLLHWEKLQPLKTFFTLQGKNEHEVPLTDKNLEHATNMLKVWFSAKKPGQRRLVFSVLNWVGWLGFFNYPKDKRDPLLSW